MSSVGTFACELSSRRLGQCLTRLSRRFCYKTNDGNSLTTAMEGSLAFNGVVKNKNSAAIAARGNTEDGGMTAFHAADTQTVAIEKLVDRID